MGGHGTRPAANGKRQTANGKRQTANGKRQTAKNNYMRGNTMSENLNILVLPG
jgi:hypothetical protein